MSKRRRYDEGEKDDSTGKLLLGAGAVGLAVVGGLYVKGQADAAKAKAEAERATALAKAAAEERLRAEAEARARQSNTTTATRPGAGGNLMSQLPNIANSVGQLLDLFF